MSAKAIRFIWCYVAVLAVVVLWVLSGSAHAGEVAVQPAPVTLQSSLSSIIAQVQQGVDAGVGFLKQELPDVIKQLLLWKAAQGTFWVLFELALFFTGLRLVFVAIDKWSEASRLEAYADKLKGERDAKEAYALAFAQSEACIPGVILYTILAVVLGIAGVIAFCLVWGNALEVLQIYIAPKVWLIEYAAELVKK